MRHGEGTIRSVYYGEAGPAGELVCSAALVPAPGQYVMSVSILNSGEPGEVLATPLFFSRQAQNGFAFAGPIRETWGPGTRLALRGPHGHGFRLPRTTRRVALLAYGDSAARLFGLLPAATAQGAEITMVCAAPPSDLPEEVEIHPLQALEEICSWADFLAADVERDSLPELKKRLGQPRAEVQVLVRTPMPCGTLAECGVCAVIVKGGWRMACKDGPVFNLRELGND